jgi:hypothetical protein
MFVLVLNNFYNFGVLRWICFLKHFDVATAVCNHLNESATRVVVLLVLLQVVRKTVDLLSEHSHLHLFGTSVRSMDLVLFDDCLLFL